MIEVEGLDEAIRAINALYDEEEIEELKLSVLHRLQIVAQDATPVDTGAMKSAWIVEDSSLYISPTSYNPRTGVPVSDYSPVISEREGIMGEIERVAPEIVEMEARRFGYGN